MSGVRDRMVAGAVRLLAQRGLQATSFSSVLAETQRAARLDLPSLSRRQGGARHRGHRGDTAARAAA